MYKTYYISPIGRILILTDATALLGLWLEGQKYFGGTLSGDMEKKDDLFVFKTVEDWLDRYFAGEKPSISELPLCPKGGEFRQGVWEILREIPYGKVMSYGEIAGKMAAKTGRARMSAQAVGGAVGHNPISIIIPCHRVVGSNGSLTGYAGGIAAKIKLLEHEGADMSQLFVPQKGTAL